MDLRIGLMACNDYPRVKLLFINEAMIRWQVYSQNSVTSLCTRASSRLQWRMLKAVPAVGILPMTGESMERQSLSQTQFISEAIIRLQVYSQNSATSFCTQASRLLQLTMLIPVPAVAITLIAKEVIQRQSLIQSAIHP
jgi:hypothetical protein